VSAIVSQLSPSELLTISQPKILADAKVEVALTGEQCSIEYMAFVLKLVSAELDIEKGTSADYTAVVDACLQHNSCISISTWGVSDAVSYLIFK